MSRIYFSSALAAVIVFAAACAMGKRTQPSQPPTSELDLRTAQRFADLALACVHKEYPNKLSHVLNSAADALPPSTLTPAFYGCYDWHSSVHGHWLLARLARAFPNTPLASGAEEALALSLTANNIEREVTYLRGEGRGAFERPYGLAWLLQLGAELREWNTSLGQELHKNLSPLEREVVRRIVPWLRALSHPVRSGEHSETAFAFGLMLDAGRTWPDKAFRELVSRKARLFFRNDRACPVSYEPSGEDFLSPCLAEADVMRRVLTRRDFAEWLSEFLPQLGDGHSNSWLTPAIVVDRSDPRLAHLDGLNLSRAWMLEGIISRLPDDDSRIADLRRAEAAHRTAGLTAVTGEHYEGGHWLGSFAVYLTTRRGTDGS